MNEEYRGWVLIACGLPTPIRIKKGWDEEGKRGTAFGYLEHKVAGFYTWVVVEFEDEPPTLFKSSGLEMMEEMWRDFR